MNRQEALEKISALENEIADLKKITEAPVLTKEDRFWGLINGLTLKIDFVKYPNSVFLFSHEKCWVECDFRNRYLWLIWSNIWSVFEMEYSLEYKEIQAFIKSLVEKHFKIRGVTPYTKPGTYNIKVEKHFKIGGVTPESL